MRFFKRSEIDKTTAIDRSYFDADRGCAELALARLADVRIEFPGDPKLEYAEGTIRKHFAGQGVAAQMQFLTAQRIDPSHLFSAFNSARYARNEAEYIKQASHARSLAPRDPDISGLDETDGNLKRGVSYAHILSAAAVAFGGQSAHGECAAFLELALGASEWSRREELSLRGARAMALRDLDKRQEQQRNARTENFASAERLALQEALLEMDRVLTLDPANPKMWNHKAAWLLALLRYDDAIEAADRAIALQPSDYPKPRVNRATALLAKERTAEANAEAEIALEMARRLGREYDFDVKLANEVLQKRGPTGIPPLKTLYVIAVLQFNAAKRTAEEFMNRFKWKDHCFDLVKGLLGRCIPFGDEWNDGYITIMTDLLHDACPEVALQAHLELEARHPPGYRHLARAMRLIAAQAEGVMARDASRLIAIYLLSISDPSQMLRVYQEDIVKFGETHPRYGQLAPRVHEELYRMHAQLPELFKTAQPASAVEFECWRDRYLDNRASRRMRRRQIFPIVVGCEAHWLGSLVLRQTQPPLALRPIVTFARKKDIFEKWSSSAWRW